LKDSKIQKFKDSKIQKTPRLCKGAGRIQRKDSKIQKFKDSKNAASLQGSRENPEKGGFITARALSGLGHRRIAIHRALPFMAPPVRTVILI
jgi:hypothetical protein